MTGKVKQTTIVDSKSDSNLLSGDSALQSRRYLQYINVLNGIFTEKLHVCQKDKPFG